MAHEISRSNGSDRAVVGRPDKVGLHGWREICTKSDHWNPVTFEERTMKPEVVEKCRRILEALVTRVRSDANALLEQTQNGAAGESELSNVPMHLGDMGTDEFLYDMNTALLANEQYIVAEAREALRRIEDGTFGRCEDCGQAIASARIEAIPYARFCVQCAEKGDRTPQVNLNDGRPMTPRDTLAPEGEMEEDRRRRVDPLESPPRRPSSDVHAAGTAGGGTAVGGLAGSNSGDGEPHVADLDDAMGSGNFDFADDRSDDSIPRSGRSGGAVGGTPARKRAV
jgi:RNA polymerase-binding transcription factor DksA